MALRTILAVIGALITLKSLWILIAPASVRRITERMVRTDRELRTYGAIALLVGIALLIAAWWIR